MESNSSSQKTPSLPGTIGFIGAGHIGSNLARLAVRHGFNVVLSNSRGPESLAGLVAELGSRARAAESADAAAEGDVVVVSIPLKNYRDVPAAPLAGKLVIDTNNYYPHRDGHISALDEETTTVAELLQDQLPDANVVKAFNTVYFEHLALHSTARGHNGRRVVPIAGNDAEAKRAAAALIDELGFDVLDAGPLSESWRFQRDTPAYSEPFFDADRLGEALSAARRYADTA